MSRRHARGFSQLLSTFVVQQMEAIPHLRNNLPQSPESLIGPEYAECTKVLELEGWIEGGSPPALRERKAEPTPLDNLHSAWFTATGESMGALPLRRLSSQICSRHGTSCVRSPALAVAMFRDLFPSASFFSLANDAHKFWQSMDSASSLWPSLRSAPSALERWKSAWAIAKSAYPGSYSSDDPYAFVIAAAPRFDLEEFRRLAGQLELRDALNMAASPQSKRKPPSTERLTGIGGRG